MAPLPLNVPWDNHGDPNIVCPPTQWTDILIFLFANYLAHCATVKPYPAETFGELATAMGLALVLPSSGITRAMDSLVRRTNLRKLNELQRAAMAGALCMVIRDDHWEPLEGDTLPFIIRGRTSVPRDSSKKEKENKKSAVLFQQFDMEGLYPYISALPHCAREPLRTSQPNRRISKRHCKIHGVYSLPVGYTLAYVPSHAIVSPVQGNQKPSHASIGVSSSYSLTQAAIAVVQTVYASVTLYKARGDQIRQYGYAAFGLTVVPYVLMSILNLLGQCACADYPTLYLVRSEVMDEAQARGGSFDGVIGTLTPDTVSHGEEEILGPWNVSATRSRPMRKDAKPGPGEHCPVSILQADAKEGKQPQQMTIVRRHYFNLERDAAEHPNEIRIAACMPFKTTEKGSVHPMWLSSPVERRISNWSSTLNILLPILFGGISLLIVGLLTHFHKGDRSTSIQRGFTMSWLVVGMLLGPFTRVMSKFLLNTEDMWSLVLRIIAFCLLYGVLLVPALGGITVVCQMIKVYGTCLSLN